MTELQLLSLGYLVFALSIGLELAWSRWKGDGGYRLGQFVVNVGHGALFQVVDGLTKALVLLPFLWVSTLAPATLPLDAAWAWLVGLVAFDFLSYWRHRHHHELAVLWAIHGVHHAAEDFNLAAGLRQAIFQNTVSWIWLAPLAFFMPLEMLVGLAVFDYLYQFFQHTRYVGSLGPLGWVLNTPSHHRVHHGTQTAYLDKNYGGILIIWDRLFGTFEAEAEEPVYGLTRPYRGLDPLWGNLVLWRELGVALGRTEGLGARLRLLLGPPGQVEAVARAEEGAPLADPQEPYRKPLAAGVFLLAMPLLAVLAWVPVDQWVLRLVLGGVIVLGLMASAALLEQGRWHWWTLWARVRGARRELPTSR